MLKLEMISVFYREIIFFHWNGSWLNFNVLGMYTDMFIEIPKEVNGWQFALNSGMILFHVILGCLLAIVSIAILVVSIKAKRNLWIILSVIGLAAILYKKKSKIYSECTILGTSIEVALFYYVKTR